MTDQQLLKHPRFPRASGYHPEWVVAGAMGSNCLWLVEWLAERMQLRSGMRVLDLGCGRALTSIFLAREFGVQVWAVDLWIGATENARRIHDAGLADRVLPLHADARSLPFAGEFFDAILSIDSYSYFGTDALYLNYLAHFVKPEGELGIAGACLTREIEGSVPDHLAAHWSQDFWALQSLDRWQRLWERTGIVEITAADLMPDGWQVWLDWQRQAHPHNQGEIDMLTADRGQYLGYSRLVGRRRGEVNLEEYCWPDNLRVMAGDYEYKPLLRPDA